MNTGIKGTAAVICGQKNCASSVGSGDLEVFATPSMVALMEEAACRSVAPFLEQGQTTVGTALSITHVSATPVGMGIKCDSELIEIIGRRLKFKVTAYDECGVIGEGTHERFIVNAEKFMAKTVAKKSGIE